MRSSLLSPGATHRGSPFAGRRRELGLLTHLIEEGLWGQHRLVRVEAVPGMGRRRLIAEALHRGPDAEWVQLAPGGVHADLRLWLRTELLDLLDTYPEAPAPSWALHTLARWEPRLRRRAAVPALSRETPPSHLLPELVGSAVGAILRALTGRTLVIVDLGLWPAPSAPIEPVLAALTRALDVPGVVALAAHDPRAAASVDESGVRTLALEPLRLPELEELASSWHPGADTDPFAGWLHRFTKGHPFFVQEVVRWLEELGHLRVDDDEGRVALLDPLSRLPLPFNLDAVMESRYQRLSPEAARLLHLIVQHDGRLEMERLRRLSPDEGAVFDEALAALRRRELLLRRSFRRPVAAASPLWTPLVEEAVRRMPRLRHRPRPPEPVERFTAPATPMAQALRRLAALRAQALSGPADAHQGLELARIARVARGRTGPAWDGVRGRLAVLAALWRLDAERHDLSLRWIRWGRSHLSPDYHPGLRRALGRIQVRILEHHEHSDRTPEILGALRREAEAAGHLVSASLLKAAEAERRRRQGQPETARRLAEEARAAMAAMGLQPLEELAAYTALRAQIDLRHLVAAERELERAALPPPARLEIEERLEALRAAPPLPLPRGLDLDEAPLRGWGWGLDDDRVWSTGRARLLGAAWAWHDGSREEIPRWLEDIDRRLAAAGQLTDLADLHEFRIWVSLESEAPADLEAPLAALSGVLARMESGERGRRLAHLLRTTRAVGSPAFQTGFRPLLRSARAPERDPVPEVRLCLLRLPRVERPASVWPQSLWPEWWATLWSEAVCAGIVGEPFSIAEAKRGLADAGDAPRADLAPLINTANQLLREDRTVGGGLWLDDDQVRINWSGIECDARRVLERAAEAERLTAEGRTADAALLWRALLDAAEGWFLPGLSGPRVAAARRLYDDAVRRAAEAVSADLDPGDVETRLRWLEGPGRVTDLARPWAEAMDRAGRPRAASALRRG